MLPPAALVRDQLAKQIKEEETAGVDVTGLEADLAACGDSLDAIRAVAEELRQRPTRADWPYVEPDDLDAIRAECDPGRELGALPGRPAVDEARERVRAAFYGSMCGCILGKPVEADPTLDELRAILEPMGEWPIRDYIPEEVVPHLRWTQFQWPHVTRGRIAWVESDDDINYSIIGMLVLEDHGLEFTRSQLRLKWLMNLPVLGTFGPERTHLLAAGLQSMSERSLDPAPWGDLVVANNEWCGALIRADAYGYACPGRPELAAELAWRDAGMTHRRTGIYGTMFVAAAIAAAPTVTDPLDVFRIAVQHVPQNSRLAEAVRFSLDAVASAGDFMEAYRAVNGRYGEFRHCRILQEVGTLVNTLHFATDVGHGICLQVMQGNDTDSFGCTAGSILGNFFGPGHLEDRWVEPFNDRIHTAMAFFHEERLSAVADRMAALPDLTLA